MNRLQKGQVMFNSIRVCAQVGEDSPKICHQPYTDFHELILSKTNLPCKQQPIENLVIQCCLHPEVARGTLGLNAQQHPQ